MEFKLVQIRVHFFLKKKSNKSFILSGLIEYHNNTEPPNGILPITVDKSNKVYVRKHEQYTDIVKHGCLKVSIRSTYYTERIIKKNSSSSLTLCCKLQ